MNLTTLSHEIGSLSIAYSLQNDFIFLRLHFASVAWYGPLYTLPVFRILALHGMQCMDFSLLFVGRRAWIYPLLVNVAKHVAEYVVGVLYNVYMYVDESNPFDLYFM